MNRVSLIGRITKDLELRQTNNGKSTCSFTLAVPNPYDKDNTRFIQIVAWNKTAEILCQYQGKGSQIGVSGSLNTRNYENNQGQKIYVTEVIADDITFLGSKQDSNNGVPPAPTSGFKDPFTNAVKDLDLPF